MAAFNNTDIHLAGDYEIQSAKNKIKIYFKCWDHHLLHKKIFFQSAWLQDSQTFITYTMQFLFYFQKSSFMLVTVACQISFSSGWPDRALKPGPSALAWPMKTPRWLLMPSWKEHRNSSYDHYYMILMSLSTLSNKTFGFLIL